jgi:hypothetical protein
MRETPLRQRYTAMPRQFMRSRIHPAATNFADRVMRHAGAPLPIWAFLAPLVIVGTRLRDELLEKTELYRTFRHRLGLTSDAGRRNAKNPVAEREMLLGLQIPPKNLDCLARFDRSRLARCWFSCNFFACRRIM